MVTYAARVDASYILVDPTDGAVEASLAAARSAIEELCRVVEVLSERVDSLESAENGLSRATEELRYRIGQLSARY